MASIFKRQKDGPWYIAYSDKPHHRRVVCGSKDHAATEALARKLESEAFAVRSGLVDPRTARFIEQQGRLLADHLAEFEKYMLDRGATEGHAITATQRTRQTLAGIGATLFSHITLGAVLGWLNDRQTEDLGR